MHKSTIGASSIIVDEQKRILLCHRTDCDLWNLPGGGLEKNESPWDCAIREAKEETGFDVEIVKLLGIYSKLDKDELIFLFESKVLGGELTLNDEADQIEYFALPDLPGNIGPRQLERIRDYFAEPKEVIMKIQDQK